MQAAAPRSAAPKRARPAVQYGDPGIRATADDTALLNALPIAAAVVGLTSKGVLALLARNPKFDEVMASTGDAAMASGDFRSCTYLEIADLMTAFLNDYAAPDGLDFREGDGVGARHFRIKLAPLPRVGDDRKRCLVSLVDRTVEGQERTLRAEMLRDSLTGLPNRLSFTETIEARGLTANEQCEHAVLVVDMLRFSRINESMGSLAGDELLITFARRLISALRAGDVLARHRRMNLACVS